MRIDCEVRREKQEQHRKSKETRKSLEKAWSAWVGVRVYGGGRGGEGGGVSVYICLHTSLFFNVSSYALPQTHAYVFAGEALKWHHQSRATARPTTATAASNKRNREGAGAQVETQRTKTKKTCVTRTQGERGRSKDSEQGSDT